MNQQRSRNLAKNLVVVATMALAGFASWAVMDASDPSVNIGTMNACFGGTNVAVHAVDCKPGAQKS